MSLVRTDNNGVYPRTHHISIPSEVRQRARDKEAVTHTYKASDWTRRCG